MDYPGKVITKNQVTPTQTSATGVWTLDDAAAAVRNNNWPVAGVPNPISKSLRFNSADSAYLNRTPASAGNQQIHTFSGWVKYSTSSSDRQIISFGNSLTYQIVFGASGTKLAAGSQQLGVSNPWFVDTAQVFRDPSAWYHIVVAVDTTQATASNRVKIYVNGTQVTAFGTANYPTQNYNTGANTTTSHSIGRREDASQYFDGYITEINWIDGQALTPSSFGMTDPQTGAWEPIRYTGTYGTNGFYLNFKDATSTTTLGNDYSGNANNWTTNNFSVTAGAGNDSLTDVPTPWIAYNTTGDVGGVVRGNYATLNPLAIATTSRTYSNGNLDVSIATTNANVFGSIAIPTSGKWYWEYQITTIGGGSAPMGGVAAGFITDLSNAVVYRTNGDKIVNLTQSAYGATYTTTDTIGVAADVDGGTVTFYKNGSSQGALTFAAGGLFPALRSNAATDNFTFNFGQRPFAYTPPAGFRSLCTTNLPNPTIGTSTTTQANVYFTPKLYTGTGSTPNAQTVGFAPDFIWFKSRTQTYNNYLFNTITSGNNFLQSNNTNAEGTSGDSITFDANGFTITAGSALNEAAQGANNMIAWCWRGSGSNATNTSGSITSTVRANTTAGFSIVTYTGTGANATVGHGLGVAPSLVIVKRRDGGSGYSWHVQHVSTGNTRALFLDSTSSGGTSSVYWNNTSPTSTVVSVGTDTSINANTGTFVMYAFAPIAGYSAFGSYTGNGSTDGPFVYTGFRPRWVMFKKTSATSNWSILDTSRDDFNVADNPLLPNLSNAESTSTSTSGAFADILSNGFKLRGNSGDINDSGATYIYAAFAEFPFKFANAR